MHEMGGAAVPSCGLVGLLGRQVAQAYDRIEELRVCTVRSRVARALGRLAREEPGRVVRLTHPVLADLVGTSREEVSRALRALRAAGLVVDMGRGALGVPDPEALLLE